MTPQEQIEATLRDVNDTDISALELTPDDWKTIRRALIFTQKALGEPSQSVWDAGEKVQADNGYRINEWADPSDTFKAMTQALWKEVCDG